MIQHNFRNEKVRSKSPASPLLGTLFNKVSSNMKKGNFLGNVLLDKPRIV